MKSDSLSASMYTIVSSANKIGNKTSETLAKCFMYSIKSKGPKMLPCGTPYAIDFIRDLKFLILTNCLRFFGSFQTIEEYGLLHRICAM